MYPFHHSLSLLFCVWRLKHVIVMFWILRVSKMNVSYFLSKQAAESQGQLCLNQVISVCIACDCKYVINQAHLNSVEFKHLRKTYMVKRAKRDQFNVIRSPRGSGKLYALFRNKEAPTHKHKARRKMKISQWRDKIFYSYFCSKKVQVINVKKYMFYFLFVPSYHLK